MKYFLVVLLIGVIAFADAFKSIDKILSLKAAELAPEAAAAEAAEAVEVEFYDKYVKDYALAWQKSFLTALGEFDENYKDGTIRDADWFVFLLCAIFNIILLLNLLIAIVNETYNTITATRMESNYKEKVQSIINM